MKEGSLQSPDVYLYIISSTILDKVFILREYMKEGSLQSLDVPLYPISSKVTTTHVACSCEFISFLVNVTTIIVYFKEDRLILTV
jgi:hypothetical protein